MTGPHWVVKRLTGLYRYNDVSCVNAVAQIIVVFLWIVHEVWVCLSERMMCDQGILYVEKGFAEIQGNILFTLTG